MMDVASAVRTMVVVGMVGTALHADAQAEEHGRKYKPMPPSAHIVVTVEKGFNGKPLQNAAVIFHAVRDGKADANLEIKTDPEGKATMDLIDVGAHLTLQVIANGFATYATEFDVDAPTKEMTVKLLRPRAQVSVYEDNDGKASQVQPGVQEPPKPIAVKPPVVKPAVPIETTPPDTTPMAPPPATPHIEAR
jgi:hypothetical protein